MCAFVVDHVFDERGQGPAGVVGGFALGWAC